MRTIEVTESAGDLDASRIEQAVAQAERRCRGKYPYKLLFIVDGQGYSVAVTKDEAIVGKGSEVLEWISARK